MTHDLWEYLQSTQSATTPRILTLYYTLTESSSSNLFMAGISLDAKEVCQIFFGPNDSDEKTLHKEDTAIIKKNNCFVILSLMCTQILSYSRFI